MQYISDEIAGTCYPDELDIYCHAADMTLDLLKYELHRLQPAGAIFTRMIPSQNGCICLPLPWPLQNYYITHFGYIFDIDKYYAPRDAKNILPIQIITGDQDNVRKNYTWYRRMRFGDNMFTINLPRLMAHLFWGCYYYNLPVYPEFFYDSNPNNLHYQNLNPPGVSNEDF